jgi:hypothetical protein
MEDGDEMIIGRPAEAALSLGLAEKDREGGGRVPVRLQAPGLSATGTIELEAWSGGLGRLVAFFDDLAAHWDGWEGLKSWGDDGGVFSMSASHDGKGLVVIEAAARSLPYDDTGSWALRLRVPVEPGQLKRIAAGVRTAVA